MYGVKLLAAPLVFGVARQALEFQSRFSLRQLIRVDSFPFPVAVNDGISESAAVSGADSLPSKSFLVLIVVTFSAGQQRAVDGAELRAAVFGMTINATNSGARMRRDNGSYKSIGRVTGRASGFHGGCETVARSAGTCIRAISNRRKVDGLCACVRVRDGRRGKSRGIEYRAGNR